MIGWNQKVQILIGLELKTVARDHIKNRGGGWVVGGGSDVKMGCTIYWKIFPVKNARGVYISVVRSFC